MSAAMLGPTDRARLAKMLALLNSDQPGEVAAAGAAASRLLREQGLDWPQILAGGPDQGPRLYTAAETAAGQYRPDIVWLQRRAVWLTPWEAVFLEGIARRSRLTEKQIATLRKIVAEVAVREAPR